MEQMRKQLDFFTTETEKNPSEYKTCAFTGHRVLEKDFSKAKLKKETEAQIKNGVEIFALCLCDPFHHCRQLFADRYNCFALQNVGRVCSGEFVAHAFGVYSNILCDNYISSYRQNFPGKSVRTKRG